MKDYRQLREDMDAEKKGIASDGNLLDNAIDTLGMAEGLWEEHYDEFVERLTNEYANKTARLPGEDARLSLARQENRDLWNQLKRAERAVNKIQKRLRGRYATLDALRSEISAEKEQAKGAESYSEREPSWSNRG